MLRRDRNGVTPSPRDAARAELRGALHDLSDALLNGAPPEQLREAVRHALALADLADEGETLARGILRNLQRELRVAGAPDAQRFAHLITLAADRL